VVSHVPAVTDLDRDPFEVISTGDLIRVDGDRGEVVITRVAG
jgi:predicted aconitase with swiveling domain